MCLKFDFTYWEVILSQITSKKRPKVSWIVVGEDKIFTSQKIVRTWNVNNSVVRCAIYMKFSQLVPQIVCDNLWKFHANRTTDDRIIKVLGSDDFTQCKDYIHVYCSKTCKTSSVMCRTLKWSFKHGNSFPTFVYVCIHFIHGANLIDNVWCLSTHPNVQAITMKKMVLPSVKPA